MAKGKPRVELLRFGNWPLFRVILLWVVLALIVFTLLGWLWGKGVFWTWDRFLTNWRNAGKDVTGLDVIKVSLTTIGGIGGTGYLVIKYRERASAESVAAEQRLHNAVGHLGGESPQIRIAGVYSLAYVADTFKGDYRQRVVNILCGYLRTKRGTWESVTDANASASEPATKKVYVSHDGAVESTVIEVLGKHLRKHRKSSAIEQAVRDDQLWCDCTIDLHGAIITELANFECVTFTANVSFKGATFTTDASFKDATFIGTTSFERTIFTSPASFECATFTTDANFECVTFTANVSFKGATFTTDASFKDATFIGTTSFERTIFTSPASFECATFTTDANFMDATFNEKHREDILFPPRLRLDNATHLPLGARWARFDDKGNIIKWIFPVGFSAS
ncbi:Uncharacterised protein [Actinomyces bovis]|uniref:Pentapeptide repeat-containing protein n=1 Tax=Actinomyces bovis TaxID=1658 RepID=A0ABY1VPC9_9ACTO|nr:pentapeptide repeat-containing protein [Actinomyces bovis]SPT53986.1 Uncharacterised protein [Actinomyces bovis]VEG53909.1 Uncharacterised protein [Actinomyces israelii]